MPGVRLIANGATGGVGVSGRISFGRRSTKPIVSRPALGLIPSDSLVAKAIARSKPAGPRNRWWAPCDQPRTI